MVLSRIIGLGDLAEGEQGGLICRPPLLGGNARRPLTGDEK
jgi:hypothetical protein